MFDKKFNKIFDKKFDKIFDKKFDKIFDKNHSFKKKNYQNFQN